VGSGRIELVRHAAEDLRGHELLAVGRGSRRTSSGLPCSAKAMARAGTEAVELAKRRPVAASMALHSDWELGRLRGASFASGN
jgi:hypothetical protein